jgi:DNA polymerase-3 subunit alpha/error-prone DNA polymerase
MNRFLTQHNFDKTPLPAQAPEFLNVSILYQLKIRDLFRDFEFLGIRPEQLSMLFHPIWKTN